MIRKVSVLLMRRQEGWRVIEIVECWPLSCLDCWYWRKGGFWHSVVDYSTLGPVQGPGIVLWEVSCHVWKAQICTEFLRFGSGRIMAVLSI